MGCFDFLFPITLGEAEIRVLPPADVMTLKVRFILKTFTLAKENDFAEVSVPGLNGEPLQFVRGHSRTLSTVLYFDGRAANTDVRQSMKQVIDLMRRRRLAPHAAGESARRCVGIGGASQALRKVGTR